MQCRVHHFYHLATTLYKSKGELKKNGVAFVWADPFCQLKTDALAFTYTTSAASSTDVSEAI